MKGPVITSSQTAPPSRVEGPLSVSGSSSQKSKRNRGERASLATERKQVEENLRQCEDKYRFLFDAVPIGICITDFEGNVITANRSLCEMLAITCDGITTSKIVDHCSDLKEREKLLGILTGSGSTSYSEVSLKDRAGEVHVALLNLDLMHMGGQKLILATFRDITRRKRAEEELTQSLRRLEETLEGTINALASTIELKDPYTAGHQRRVACLACAIANEMGLAQDRIDGIEMAGLVHDVGKIAIPAEILTVPRRLTEAEFSLVKMHPQVGYDILKPIAFPWPVAEIVLQHHERIDGSGYPQALCGRGVLLKQARILAVADVVEAMSSHRPYRPSLGMDKALAEISGGRGILYDPDVVDGCVSLFSDRGFKFNVQSSP